MFSLGDVGVVALICWTLRRYVTAAGTFFAVGEEGPSGADDLKWCVVTRCDSLRVVKTRVISPLNCYIAHMRKLVPFSGVILEQLDAEPVGIIENAALNCFWRLLVSVVKRCMAERKIAYVEGDADYNILALCIRGVFPKCLMRGSVRFYVFARKRHPMSFLRF